MFVALRHKHQRPVDRHDLVHEHGDVHRPRLRHAVVARPGAVILVPLPDIALERRLGVDLVLVHVELFAEHLLDRTDQARMIAEQAKRLVVGVGGERGSRRPGLLAPHFLAVGRVDLLGLAAQDCDFLFRKAAGQEQPAFVMKLPELLCREFHRDLLPSVRHPDPGQLDGITVRPPIYRDADKR